MVQGGGGRNPSLRITRPNINVLDVRPSKLSFKSLNSVISEYAKGRTLKGILLIKSKTSGPELSFD